MREMSTVIRVFSAIVFVLSVLQSRAASADTGDKVMTVTLLGTGSPIPEPSKLSPKPSLGRASATTLVQAGDQVLLFDAGRGVVDRLAGAGISAPQLTAVFLTHFHSDHTSDLPDLWLSGRIHMGWGDRKAPLEVWGPAGTKAFMENISKAYQTDVLARPNDIQIGLLGSDFASDGVVYEKGGVKVTAFTVDHGVTKPAVGYRIDYKGHSVLISGDTRYNENVIKYGEGVDLLIHEVLAIKSDVLTARPDLKRIFNLHTSPEQCGQIFAKTKPKLAVYSHIVLFGGSAIGSDQPPPTEDDLVEETRRSYSGPLQVGADLMSFNIGDRVETIAPK